MLNDKKLVSVIVPVYNGEECIKRCLESIMKQSYKDIELIVINDGSTDNTEKILKEIEQSKFNIRIVNKENEGVSKARNSGMEIAKGEYIYFVDSDDYLSSETIEMLVNSMISLDVDMALCGYECIVTTEQKLQVIYFQQEWRKNVREYLEVFSQKYYCLYYGALWNKLYRADIIKDNNIYFKESLPYAEDFIFNINYLEKIDYVGHVPKALYHYSMLNEGSLSRKKIAGKQLWEWTKERFGYFINACRKYNVEQKCIDKIYNDFVFELVGPIDDIIREKTSYKQKCYEIRQLLSDSEARKALNTTEELNYTLKLAKKAINKNSYKKLIIILMLKKIINK